MNLYILRHGIAVEPGTAGCERDSERPLTPEGAHKLARIAAAMKAMGLSFDLILSSPYVRARQTAEIVARSFRATKMMAFSEALAVGGSARALIEEIRRHEPELREALLVGHEPGLSRLISVLTGGQAVTLKKGGLGRLCIAEIRYGRCASLEWLLSPKQMVLMT